MTFKRSSGILLHPTSLPGPYGIGDIGPEALRWIDFLAGAGCGLWQVLPLGPTGYGDSPYQCFSAFAGNPYLISPESLQQDGLLTEQDLQDRPPLSEAQGDETGYGSVDYGAVIGWKTDLLSRAFRRFQTDEAKSESIQRIRDSFGEYRRQQADWLDDYALFMALKDAHQGASWNFWEAPLKQRNPEALQAARNVLHEAVERHAFWQFLFHKQWQVVRMYARKRNITLIGDAPIFVAHDSADVWGHQELFYLDDKHRPRMQAGVPPDYFSPTGQLWGNPLYRWRVHKASGYAWWIARLRMVLSQVDLVRLDHFRGFAAYWEVPGRAKTAEKGRWVKAPGMDFLRALRNGLGKLPIIAEDLGVITPDVVAMRDTYGLPGMKIMQFAFGSDAKDPFLPHNYPTHCVVYTGTHDNDTVRGWYDRIAENEKSYYRRYLGRDGSDVSWDMIRACWSSVAVYALAPMQDFLGLGNEARMNYPGNPSGNWTWRLKPQQASPQLMQQIRDYNEWYDRMNLP